MSLPFILEFKLGGSRGDGRHPYVNPTGAFLGQGVPLLEKDALGRWRPRRQSTLEKLMGIGYGAEGPLALGWRVAQLGCVAQALNKGDLCLASISLVHMALPPLPSGAHACAMAKADGLVVKSWEDEARVPAGNPDGGQWTGGSEQLHLPPGERIDELGDLLEWIANAKPEDEAAIRGEIARLYYGVGDTNGGDALNRALSDVLQSGGDVRERQAVLEDYESYTRADPAEVAQFGRDLVTGALLSPPSVVPEAAPAGTSVWEMGWATRGQAIEQELGMNLATNNPVIDMFSYGIATSIKSIDLNAATYQDADRLAARIGAYVDRLAAFNNQNWSGFVINSKDISGRTLLLAIPKGSMTDAQLVAINGAQTRAAARGVKIKLVEFR